MLGTSPATLSFALAIYLVSVHRHKVVIVWNKSWITPYFQILLYFIGLSSILIAVDSCSLHLLISKLLRRAKSYWIILFLLLIFTIRRIFLLSYGSEILFLIQNLLWLFLRHRFTTRHAV
jgi:hypothetical protein